MFFELMAQARVAELSVDDPAAAFRKELAEGKHPHQPEAQQTSVRGGKGSGILAFFRR